MARSNLDAFLDSAFRIRPGEGRQVGLMFIYLMGVVSAFIVGRTVRDTLFLHRVPLDMLPLMYIAVAGAVGITAYVYSRVADRYRRDRLVTFSLWVFISIISCFWLLLALDISGGAVYAGLYIAVEIIGALSIIQFWTFANDIFYSRQAKRLFVIIGAGGVISNITCGFTIGSIAPLVGSENLLLVCVGLFFVCIAAVRGIAQKARSELELAIKKPKKSRIGIAADSGTVLHSKHLKIIAGVVVLTFLAVTIIDFQFKVIAKHSYPGESELATFFGFFYGFTGIIACLIQFFLTGRILERSGIVAALCVLPIALIMGAGAMLAVPLIAGIVAVTIAKGAENILRYTLNDATMQLLYVPVPSHLRGRAKAFIDGILKPASIGSAGLLLFLLGRFFEADTLALDLAYLDLILLGGWLTLVIGIRKEYVKSLISTLHTRRLDLNSPFSLVTDEQTVAMLRHRLVSRNDNHVLHALELLPSMDVDFQPELTQLLSHESTEVRIRTLRLIGASGRIETHNTIHPLMSDEVPEVRAAAIGAFCAIGRERAIRAATPFLSDTSPIARGAAVAALIKHGGLDGILTAAEALKGLLGSDDPQERLQGAHVLAEIKVRNFFQPVLELLQDSDLAVRIAAIEAASEMRSMELVPKLIYKLADPVAGQAAVRALANYGRDIEHTLFKVLSNKQEDLAIRRRVPRILAQIGEQEAVTQLIKNLDTRDAELRSNIARAAARIRERTPRVRVDDALLDNAIRSEIHRAYQALAIIDDLQLPLDHLLPEALFERHRNRLGLAFRLLEIRYPARTIQLVYSNLDAESKAVRANALEVVDNVLSKDESRLLLPLLEEHSSEERIRVGSSFFNIDRATADEWLVNLLDDPHPWIVTCTIYLLGEQNRTGLRKSIAKLLKSRDPVVRETAFTTLARLVQNGNDEDKQTEELTRLARAAADDKVMEVRRAGSSLLSALAAPAT